MIAAARLDHVGARDGTALLLRHWPVRAGEPWAALLIVHGLAEHCGRYEHVGSQLAQAGIDTHALRPARVRWIGRRASVHRSLVAAPR